MRSGRFVPYWNEVVNEKCVKLARFRHGVTGSLVARAEEAPPLLVR